MKKVFLRKGAVALCAAAALFFASCSDIAENEAEILSPAQSQSLESSDRAAISGISSFYADNLSHGTFTSNVTSGNYTVYATSSKTVSTPYSSATLQEKTFKQALALGGAGVAGSYRCISFETAGSATVTVFATGASGRYLALVNSKGEVVSKQETSSSIAAYTYSAPSAGTYYLESLGSGINIFYIKTDSSGSSSSSSSSSGSSSSSSGSSSSSSSVSKITLYKGSSESGTYSSIKSALAAVGSSGSYTIVIPKGTYNENYIYYNGSASITIRGATSSYGDTVIKGHGTNMATEKGRELLELSGSCNVVLKNLTLQSDYSRATYGKTDVQSEVLGFDSTGTLAAYNCAFKGHQDTMRTTGKTWFYKCVVEGDVDFIWMESSGIVALYEECTISSVYDSSASSHEAYVMAPRATKSSTMGKGVVLLNCTLNSASGNSTYLFRNPWGSNSNYYNQGAVVNCSFGGSGWVSSAAKNAAMGTGDQQYIGWKMDSNVASKFGSRLSSIGTLSSSVKSAEYSNRNVILNRKVNTSGKFSADSSSWDVDSLGNNNGFFGSSSSSGSSSSGSSSSGSSSSGSSSSGSSSSGSSLSINDKPVGFASVSKPSSTVTVSSRSDFINYAKKGGYIIYVNGMIDLSDGYLPSSAGGSTSKLDSLVKSNTSSKYSSYSSFVTAYAKGCSTSTDDKSSSSPASSLGKLLWACNSAYGNIIKVNIGSNTWIVGKNSSSGLKGGSLNISSVSNVVLRNLTIQDAYDPFPHHEANDGYNAQWDCVVIQGSSSNVWIDHCTFRDTMGYTTVKTGGSTSEKWQTYDGLCDIKGSVKNITISWNRFQDHDKTMLIGSSDSDGSNSTRTVTLHHNYFYNCGQRLPMVRNTRLHMFNNYYDASNPRYAQQYAVGVRANALIIAENNTFGSGIKYSFKDTYGTLYASGNSDSSSGGNKSSTTSSKPFSVSYSYSLDSASASKSSVSSNAGAKYSM
ncbi:pectinesterase family protein [uncultured Treponema sp.]|uniref:pectinesterase family protein n=1 Tax=uncultured Treponema sp. TaxID=162155 RepID=UPI0025F4181F|nr:pectinesterase family protein [uncultured Treponema sp.]